MSKCWSTTTSTSKARLLSVSGRPLRDAASQIRGGVAVFRDITEQREIQEHLRRSEERFASPSPAARTASGTTTRWPARCWFSPRFKELLGYTDDGIPERHPVLEKP